jgi:hypothetical protein
MDVRFGGCQREDQSVRGADDCNKNGEDQYKCKKIVLIGERTAAERGEGDETGEHSSFSRRSYGAAMELVDMRQWNWWI